MTERASTSTDLSSADQLLKAWSRLPRAERNFAFGRLSQSDKFSLFRRLEPVDQAKLALCLDEKNSATLLASLELEDLVQLARHWSEDEIDAKLATVSTELRGRVSQMLAAARGTAGGLIRSRFVSLSPELSVEDAIHYLRDQANDQIHNIFYGYVLDKEKKLLGIVPFRQLFLGMSDKKVEDIMKKDILTVQESATEDEVAHLFSTHALMALPVVDSQGHMKGIVTADNIVSKLQEEATEDIQKLGGMEALDAPYWQIAFTKMVKKRAGWLMALFIGEMFTATAMGFYEKQIERAVVLALFIPLIISSGGRLGSQATTLIIRAMALQEVRIKDWWRVLYREFGSGLALGGILGFIGFLRIALWPAGASIYGEHYLMIAVTVGVSLIGIVLWGTLVGSMLPFLLRRLGFDPASASAPFVATLVDVTGLIIYFTVATFVLGGTLL